MGAAALWRISRYGCETWTLLADSEKRAPVLRNQVPEKTSLCLLLRAQDRRLSAAQDQLLYGSTRTSSGNWQETETCMVLTSHTPRQPLQNHPSGHLGGWAAPWSAKKMLAGQHQRVAIPAYARTVHKGLLQKRLEEDLCWIVVHVPHDDPIGQGTELNWTER